MDAASLGHRRISQQATARLAEVHDFTCLDARPPPPSRTQFQTTTDTRDCPPPIPKKQDAKVSRNLLHVPVPLLQKVGEQIATRDMRPDAVTHIRINLPSNTSEPPDVPPRTRNSPSSVPRPVPSLERGSSQGQRVSNEYVDTPHLPNKKKTEVTHTEPVIKDQVEKGESIFCRNCGKCKCESCTDPKLPAGKEYLANNIVDYCSCMCCVKGLFYHCVGDKESEESDKPCACFSQPHCCQRWTTMAVLSLFLPCLCFYWPLKGCVKLTKHCYSRCMVRGCRCQRERSAPPQTRLLLESSTESST